MKDDPAPPAARAAALKEIFAEKGLLPDGFVEDFTRHAEETWISRNGARMVARAWTDAAFRTRLLADATAAAREMGFELPKHHRHLVALENTPDIHNVIVCTQCSCTAFTIIGAAPDWYKDLDYRARIVRHARPAPGRRAPATALARGGRARRWRRHGRPASRQSPGSAAGYQGPRRRSGSRRACARAIRRPRAPAACSW